MATDAPLESTPDSSVGAVFIANNKSAAVLSAIMLTAWSAYFQARADLKVLSAEFFDKPEDSDLAVGQIVQAMHSKAQNGGLSAAETLRQLQEIVLPYLIDAASREVATETKENAEDE